MPLGCRLYLTIIRKRGKIRDDGSSRATSIDPRVTSGGTQISSAAVLRCNRRGVSPPSFQRASTRFAGIDRPGNATAQSSEALLRPLAGKHPVVLGRTEECDASSKAGALCPTSAFLRSSGQIHFGSVTSENFRFFILSLVLLSLYCFSFLSRFKCLHLDMSKGSLMCFRL